MSTAVALPRPSVGPDSDLLRSLRQLRWAVRAVLLLGVAASVAANVLHAHPNLISQLIAAWPPLALLLTVELISRIPAHRRALAVARLIAACIIAGIAAWVSYWHMAGVAARYGETGHAAATLLPASVDGLVIVASISLMEIAGRINRLPRALTVTDSDDGITGQERPHAAPARQAATPARPCADDTPDAPPTVDQDAVSTDSADVADQKETAVTGTGGRPTTSVRADTTTAVAYWCRQDPGMRPADIAARIGRSERTVRRHLPKAQQLSARDAAGV